MEPTVKPNLSSALPVRDGLGRAAGNRKVGTRKLQAPTTMKAMEVLSQVPMRSLHRRRRESAQGGGELVETNAKVTPARLQLQENHPLREVRARAEVEVLAGCLLVMQINGRCPEHQFAPRGASDKSTPLVTRVIALRYATPHI